MAEEDSANENNEGQDHSRRKGKQGKLIVQKL